MPRMTVNGVSLAYEEYGEGFPLVWCHDYGGSLRVWGPQVSHFSRRYRVIVYNARGYPPSDVPADPEAYDQEKSVEDLHRLLQGLGISRAYVGGLSMGASIAVVYALRHPDVARAIIPASGGSGFSDPQTFRENNRRNADELLRGGMDLLRERSKTMQPNLRRKDPLAWAEYVDQYLEHSPEGLAHVARNVLGRRPIWLDFDAELLALPTPALIVVGDDDEACREPGLYLKRTLPNAGLLMLPKTGHLVNLEEADLFNRAVSDFLTAVEAGKWPGASPA